MARIRLKTRASSSGGDKMHLLTALDIGKECALHTVGEAIYNINLRAGQIFAYGEISIELKQLYYEWNTIKLNFGFTSDSSVIEVMDWMKKQRGI